MSKTIVELILQEEPAQSVSIIEKTLSKKLFGVISGQKNTVARDTYGTLEECFGADEQPEFMQPADNAYQVFYVNALKKFGVNGPQDFQDPNTRQQFFNYLDMNWKAQDSVQPQQGQSQGMGQVGMQPQAPSGTGSNIDLGTQTQLPAPAAQPQPPQQPQPSQPQMPGQQQPLQMPNQRMPMGGTNDPSFATMAPAGPSIDKVAPLGPDGDDQQLDGIQNVQNRDGRNGFNMGQSAMGGADQFGNGAANDDDQDPDLEIGDNDFADDNDNERNGNNGFDLSGDNEDQGDENVPDDDEFADDDAYNVDHSDFAPKGDSDGEDQDSDDFGHGGGSDDDDSDNQFGHDDDDDSDDDDSDDSDDSDADNKDRFDRDSSVPDDDSDDKDPDLEIGDKKSKPSFPPKKKAFGESLKPSDRSRKTRKSDSAKATRLAGKKVQEGEDGEIDDEVTFGEDFTFDLDNAEDQAYLKEQNAMAQIDPSVVPRLRMARRELNKVKGLRDAASSHIKKQLGLAKSPEERHALAKVHANNRQHFRNMAQTIKGLHTGQTSGSKHSKRSKNPEMGQKDTMQEPIREDVYGPNHRPGIDFVHDPEHASHPFHKTALEGGYTYHSSHKVQGKPYHIYTHPDHDKGVKNLGLYHSKEHNYPKWDHATHTGGRAEDLAKNIKGHLKYIKGKNKAK